VALDIQEGSIREARIALGGIATKSWRSKKADNALAGRPATEVSFAAAAEAALAAAAPREQNAWKAPLAKHTDIVALTEAAQRRHRPQESH